MGGTIHAYFDCVSPYSYFAFVHLRKHRPVLATHGVKIEIHPVFLGGINVGSGNTPPWKLPAKARYGEYDRKQAVRYFGVADFTPPSFFPILSLLPQRSITYIKSTYPTKFEDTFLLLWHWLFYLHRDISQPAVLTRLLTEDAGFTAAEADAILAAANEKKWKDALLARTQEALDRGAFGAPWFWVVREGPGGEEEETAMFFGSDRFHYMWTFLNLPFDDIKIRPGPLKSENVLSTNNTNTNDNDDSKEDTTKAKL
ncbi:hypothetical protein VTN77DRAFT_7759 [Rasamsonia byssochlamydoides]|uniref:uncharacterized protein n=1 Tax=Rasamsonia byssochlamydoides TaxID=89139 RepID=UPI0037435052